VDNNQNITPDQDPRLLEALRQVGNNDIQPVDELTRRRHLAQMRSARSTTHRLRFIGIAAAFMLVIGGFVVTRNSSTIDRQRDLASEPQELAPLKTVSNLTAVPFERTEDYVILEVSSARATEVGSDITAALGSAPTVIGKDGSSTTYVVPASFAKTLSNTTGIKTTIDSPVRATIEQTPVPSWGLDRLDATDVPLNDSYRYTSTGNSSYVYVIDTGIYSGHSDFAGRVTSGYSAINDGNGSEDCNGHGTHVAGTIAGSTYGVAKSTRVVAVRVLDCAGSGFSSSVVAGINWVIQSHPGGAGIINMSLGGSANTAIDSAVADATAAGLTVVVAAGNSSTDACSSSPARAPSALTIGAIDQADSQAAYSNFGSCVDLWAPGTGITSDWIGGSSATRTISGTSMATPHVAGLAARLAQAFPGISSSGIVSKLSTSNASALAVTTFVEADVPVDAPTTTLVATTTTLEVTTTTAAPDVTVPPTTTVVPTTTIPRATTTTIPRATTTTVPRITTTTVRPNNPEPKKPEVKKPEVKTPKNFAMNYQFRSDKNVLVASWVGDNTPESYRISCVAKNTTKSEDDEDEDSLEAETLKNPTNKVINFTRTKVTYLSNGRAEIVITDIPAVLSRCWIVALIGTTQSERSNVAVTPQAPAAPTTTTSTTSTTTSTTSTTTVVPSTTVAPSTTVSPSTTVAPARSTQTTQPKKTTTTTKPPVAKKKIATDD
jgi:subtilisin family serine protease